MVRFCAFRALVWVAMGALICGVAAPAAALGEYELEYVAVGNGCSTMASADFSIVCRLAADAAATGAQSSTDYSVAPLQPVSSVTPAGISYWSVY